LAVQTDRPEFGRATFSPFDQRWLYQRVRDLARQALATLRRRHDAANVGPPGRALLEREEEMLDRARRIVRWPWIDAMRIRCHGDYHLGQVLYTGDDFVIIDFEGEPARPLAERKRKSSPLRDVAGMLRSFDYAAYAAWSRRAEQQPDQAPRLEAWRQFWTTWTGTSFLRSYWAAAAGQPFLPVQAESAQLLLDAYLLEKALYELDYELNNRPHWARIPLHGILQVLDERSPAEN
jgi:maltose alpha-D-glucosyltransferase / alpha-amylase